MPASRLLALWAGGAYVVMLMGVIVYGIMTFAHLQGTFLPEDLMESSTHLGFARYGEFLQVSSALLAVQLGIAAGLIGQWQRRNLWGLAALVAQV